MVVGSGYSSGQQWLVVVSSSGQQWWWQWFYRYSCIVYQRHEWFQFFVPYYKKKKEGEHYLAFAQRNHPIYHGNLWLPLWKLNKESDTWFQVMNKEILTQDAFGLEYFELAGDHFLVVCNGKRPTKAPPDGIGIKSGGWVIGPDEASFVLKFSFIISL